MADAVRRPEGLVAFWDFAEAGPPFRSGDALVLDNGPDSDVRVVDGGPFGRAVRFDGVRDHLRIPSANVGALELARTGRCTVLAWVNRRTAGGQHFIAGRWNEDDDDPNRQYGLFINLAGYGGEEQVIGHVSYTGDATPGYPFSRDYSASARRVTPGTWRFIGFTYDGAQALSYLDGIADARPRYTDWEGFTYSKNPYMFTAGLNPSSGSDFTVGANRVGSKLGPGTTVDGMALFFAGDLGGLAVFERALSRDEVMAVHLATVGHEPLHRFDFFRADGWGVETASAHGWRCVRGERAMDTTEDTASDNFLVMNTRVNSFLFRTASGVPENTMEPAFGYCADLGGLAASALKAVTFKLSNRLAVDTVRLCVRIGASWYASDESFSMTRDGGTGYDWRSAETKTLAFGLEANRWRAMEFVPGTVLSVGDVLSGTLADGDLTGVGFWNGGLASGDSVVRIGDVRMLA